jgi:hypothetical protein
MAEPEADGGGVALELEVATGAAVEETGEKVADGRGVEEEEEGPELGGVVPVLEGVEVALGGAGAGPSAASLAGWWVVRHWGPPLCVSVNARLSVGRDGERIIGWQGRFANRPYDGGRPRGVAPTGLW